MKKHQKLTVAYFIYVVAIVVTAYILAIVINFKLLNFQEFWEALGWNGLIAGGSSSLFASWVPWAIVEKYYNGEKENEQ